MRSRTRRGLIPLLLAALVGTLGIISSPLTTPASADDGHPYTTPGERTYQGRQWRTTCEKYSSTVERCRAEIMATQVDIVDGKYTFVNRYAFNNLTYLPSDRNDWKGNPLATPGMHTLDGRAWRTECFTQWTGPNGCRSFVMTSVIEATSTPSGWSFAVVDKWLFNNVVQFTPPKPTPAPEPKPLWDNPCNAKHPTSFTFTKEGRPHMVVTPYKPNTHYNPISLANFIQAVLAMPIVEKHSDPKQVFTEADKLCLALLGADHLMGGAKTKEHNGIKSLWFPYPFDFSANPAVDILKGGWYSGLGQAGAMAAFLRLYDYTGDKHWENIAKQVYESYHVPLEAGGFTNRNNGFLWFEEYPTTLQGKSLPTVVYNGHFENVIALGNWSKRYPSDTRAKALLDEAIADLKPLVPLAEVELEGGTMTSYDMLRGFPAAPLRAVNKSASGQPAGRVTDARLNGDPLNRSGATTIPTGTVAATPPNKLRNSRLMLDAPTGRPFDWTVVNNNMAGVTFTHDGWVGVHPRGTMWAGIQQVIPAGTFPANSKVRLTMTSRLEIPQGQSGTGGKVPVYSDCPDGKGGTVTKLLHEDPKARSRVATTTSTEFTAPAANCSMRIQLLTYSYSVKNTTVWYKNIEMRQADGVGTSVTPQFTGENLKVHQRPKSVLEVKGQGTVDLQAHMDGHWQTIASNVRLGSTPTPVTIPERFTGRNINYNYHDGHISELQQIACLSGDVYFDDFAKEWSKMSANFAYRTPSGSCKLTEKVLVDHSSDDSGVEIMVIPAEQQPMVDKPEVMPTSLEVEDAPSSE